MSEIDLRDEPCVEQAYTVKSKKKTAGYETLTSVGYLCDCVVWFARTTNGLEYHFFGMESDVQMAMHMTSLIEVSVRNEVEAFKRTSTYIGSRTRRSASHSFAYGMTERLEQRIREIKRENIKQAQKREESRIATEEALSRINATGIETPDAPTWDAPKPKRQDLVIVKAAIVRDEFAKKGLRLRAGHSSSRIRDYDARSAGRTAGDRVNLNRPISGGNSGGYYLK